MYYIPNKLLYLAIPKTGSTAITNHLDSIFEYRGDNCVKTEHEQCSYHPLIWDAVNDISMDNLFFCTIVRNPYSRFVSHYFYCLHVMECWDKYKSTPYGKRLIDRWRSEGRDLGELRKFKELHPDLKGYQANLFLDKPTDEYVVVKKNHDGVKNLGDYVHKVYECDLMETFILRQTPFTHYSWNYDGPKMDFIGKCEELQQCCDFICNEVNVKSKKLPKLNEGKHGHWSEYYTKDTKKLVGLMYDMDFKYFGYEK